MSGREDFYIGYQKQAPAGLARYLRLLVIGLVVLGAGLAASLVALQARFDPGVFEFGIVREFEGRIRAQPYPILIVDPPVAYRARRLFFGER